MPSSDASAYLIGIKTSETKYPPMADIAAFLYDLNLLYEFSRVVEDERYLKYKFNRFSTYRNSRRVDRQDQLSIARLTKQSPLEIILILSAAGGVALPAMKALKVFVDTLEQAVNAPLKHKLLKLQAAKLEQDLAEAAKEKPQVMRDVHLFREHLRSREGEYYFERVEKHLQNSPIKPTVIGVEPLQELSDAEGAAELLEMEDDEESKE